MTTTTGHQSTRRHQGARNEATMSKSDKKQRNVFRENVIHVGSGFVAKERPHVLEGQSTWDSEGGATGQGESLPNGGGGPAPRGFGR